MRIVTAPIVSLGLGASLRWASGLSWDVLLRAIAVAALALWVAAVTVTIWCVFVTGDVPRRRNRHARRPTNVAALW